MPVGVAQALDHLVCHLLLLLSAFSFTMSVIIVVSCLVVANPIKIVGDWGRDRGPRYCGSCSNGVLWKSLWAVLGY